MCWCESFDVVHYCTFEITWNPFPILPRDLTHIPIAWDFHGTGWLSAYGTIDEGRNLKRAFFCHQTKRARVHSVVIHSRELGCDRLYSVCLSDDGSSATGDPTLVEIKKNDKQRLEGVYECESLMERSNSNEMYQVFISGYRLANVSHGKPYYVYTVEMLDSNNGARYLIEKRYSEFNTLHRVVIILLAQFWLCTFCSRICYNNEFLAAEEGLSHSTFPTQESEEFKSQGFGAKKGSSGDLHAENAEISKHKATSSQFFGNRRSKL